MKEQKDIVIVDWGGRIPTDSEEEYLAHLLCLGGSAATVSTNGISSYMRGICPLSASGNLSKG